jgi:predicted DNA-binding protein
MNLIRTNFYFPRELLDRLRAIADRTGYTVSALIRSGAEREILVQEEFAKGEKEDE